MSRLTSDMQWHVSVNTFQRLPSFAGNTFDWLLLVTVDTLLFDYIVKL